MPVSGGGSPLGMMPLAMMAADGITLPWRLLAHG